MKTTHYLRCSWLLVLLASAAARAGADEFRPPAVPLVTIDPYTSCWSTTDKLSADWPRHWTGKIHAMCGFVRVDGKPWRFMGKAEEVPEEAQQQSLTVTATQTMYEFKAGAVNLKVKFTSPLLLTDLNLVSRPANYVTFEAVSTDGKPHQVQIYFDMTGEWCVNQPSQQVLCDRATVEGLDAMRIGSKDQRVLATKGDDIRIDWGFLYLAVTRGTARTVIGEAKRARADFAANSTTALQDEPGVPRSANDRWPALSATFDLGAVADRPVRRHLTIAYDDMFSVEYFQHKLRPWWRN